MSRAVLGAIAALVGWGCASDALEPVREVRLGTHVEDWRDEILYQIVVDRFANGDPRNDWRVDPDWRALGRYKGGDWQGIIERLDYLEALGVTAIWISPIVLNVDTDAGVDGYHGYWQVDLERLNPHFGDLATLRALVRACHARGIKVVLDVVTNHMGQVFYYDINMNGRPDVLVAGSGTRSAVTHVTEYDPDYDPRGIQAFTSLGEAGPAPIRFFDMPEIFRVPPSPAVLRRPEAYHRRGRVTDWGVREQVLFGDFPGGLKDLATGEPAVREALVDAFVRWVLWTDVDGFRIDTLKHVEHEFWAYFAPEVRRRLAAAGKRNFILFGEAFDGDEALVGSYTAPGLLDSVFHFPHKFQVFDDVFLRGAPTRRIEALLERRETFFGTEPQPDGIGIAPARALVHFIDNHDVPRFLFYTDDPRRLRAALAYLLTQDGIPCIYYGTEQDFFGGNDPANREPLWWSGYRTDGETFRWIARLTRIRRALEPLRRGDFRLRWVSDRVGDEADAGIVAFERVTPSGGYALVVINARDGERRTAFGGEVMRVGEQAPPGTVLVDVLGGERFTVASSGTLEVRVGPYGARILVRESDRVTIPSP
ncbi:MAG: alpha-amylase family glycosyl hydrolase [Myxococcota bacterium]|nr:alpha-amylase family glycosyl hydrolase [Myxococcota bacterium]MDW8362979.1 alpha-amylase family glycosyl hydrolase [Myxococcales bacterium]